MSAYRYPNSDREWYQIKISFKTIFAVLLCIVAIVVASQSYHVVPAGHRAVKFNTITGLNATPYGEGITFKVPFMETFYDIDCRINKVEHRASAASKDLQTVHTTVALNYHPIALSTPLIFQEIGLDYVNRVVDPAIQEAVKSITAQYTAEELITKREDVKTHIQTRLVERLSGSHIQVTALNITDFNFSEAFNSAIEQKVTAEQNALAAKNKLEQVRYEAEGRISQAKGEAEAIRIQAEAVRSQGGAEYVQLQAINKWNGQLPQFTGVAGIPFVTVPQR